MSSSDDFFGGLKSDKDKVKEWTDAAQFFVDIRRGEPEPVEPLPELEKDAGVREVARSAAGIAKRFDPTGLANSLGTKDARIAAGIGAGAFGTGVALSSRGKKSLGGQSQLEHSLHEAKKERDAAPAPKSFMGKMRNNFGDFSAGLATTARKHPVAAGAMGALGGAKAGVGLLSKLTRKAT